MKDDQTQITDKKKRYAAGVLFKATRSDRYVLPKVSHVHAEDPDLAPVAVLA